jgi:geranylgeranyl diphosphate synthase type II
VHSYSHLSDLLNEALGKEQTALQALSPKEMYEPMGYIIGLGGKRVRPLLTLIGCELFGADPQKALNGALAVELFHNFSLIHDDILDNAPLRRGHATVHEKWNHNIALLSGDGMMVKAFEILSQGEEQHIPTLLKLFSKTGIEVCEGQQEDMNFETQEQVSVEDYLHMITNKTAVLLGCSLQMGAICAGAPALDQAHLYEFGKHVGIAFQILDDILDVYADHDKFGKQVGGDIISNKKTFLLLKAFELADSAQQKALRTLLSDKAITNSDKVSQVTALYDALHIKDIASREANLHTEVALKHLAEIAADATKKEHLKHFAENLLNRHT